MDDSFIPEWVDDNSSLVLSVSVLLWVAALLAYALIVNVLSKRSRTLALAVGIANLVWPYVILHGGGQIHVSIFGTHLVHDLVSVLIFGFLLKAEIRALVPLSEYGGQLSLSETSNRLGIYLGLLIIPLRYFIPDWEWSQAIIYGSITYVIWQFINRTNSWKYAGFKYAIRIGVIEGFVGMVWTYVYLWDHIYLGPSTVALTFVRSIVYSAGFAAAIYIAIVWVLGKSKQKEEERESQSRSDQQQDPGPDGDVQ